MTRGLSVAPEYAAIPTRSADLCRYRIVHGLRIALAFMLTFLLTREESNWPLITLVVVMSPISFWGNVLSRVLQRVVGTIFGTGCGVGPSIWSSTPCR